MRFRLTLLSIVVVVLLTGSVVATSQVATGIYSFGAFDSKGFDTINIGNLNSHFEIPVFSKQGRGGLNFSRSLVYDSAIWTPTLVAGSKTWQPAALWGWQADIATMTGNLSFTTVATGFLCSVGFPRTFVATQGDFVYTDVSGKNHQFWVLPPVAPHSCPDSSPTLNGTFSAADNSGINLIVAHYGSYQIQLPNGQIIQPTYNAAASGTSVTDNNGNKITFNGSTTFTDTTGTAVLTLSGAGTSTSPRSLTYPTYVSGTAGTAAVTVNYVSYNVKTAFGCSGIAEYSASAVNLVDNIVLADGQTYYFTYEATPGFSGKVTGRLASIELPGGGHINYTYSGGSNGIECQDGGTATLTRSMPDDPAGASSWTYTRTPGASGAANSHTEVADGMSTPNHSTYDFVNDTADTYRTPFVVSQSQYTGAVSGTPPLAVSTCYNGATTCVAQSLTLPISSTSITTALDGTTSVKNTTQTFNSYGLLTAQTDYDYGSGIAGSQVDAVIISYAGLSNGIVNLPGNVAVYGGQSSAIQITSYSYDDTTPTTTFGLPQHISVSGSRGNLTYASVSRGGSAIVQTQSNTYDDAGQLQTAGNLLGNSTSYTYDTSTDTFVTGIALPTTGSVTHTTGGTYDIPSGLLLTSVDQNSNSTSYTYDNMLRPLTISLPASGAQSYTYSLASTTPYVTASVLHSGSSYISTTNDLDPYGRVATVEKTDTPSNDLVKYIYDADGRLSQVSNPYRSGATPVYTQATYDGLGRTKIITDSDGASQSTVSYYGNATTLTDEAGHLRELLTDAAGRTSKVLEPYSTGTPTLALETDYAYDQNQTGSGGSSITYQTVITQKGGASSPDWRTRTFTYDPLGRLLNETTPEAGTTTYTYPIGMSSCAANLSAACTRTDANGTVTTYAYDALSRLTGKTYSGSTIASNTSSVSYSYDQTSDNGLTISNGKGLRTGMSDGSGATAWSYYASGNVAAVKKTIGTVTEPAASYTYNADSTLNTVTDFGGTTFTYSYDVAGRPTQLVDGASNSYAASALYTAAGQLSSVNHQLTSGGGAYVRSWAYNNRMQPSLISATLNGSPIQSLTYGYGTSGTNSGNILTIANGMDSSHHRDQTYSYDNLNRILTGGDGNSWQESYSIDNWGNLYSVLPGSGTSGPNNWNLGATGADPHNHLSNQFYDSAGEVTLDQHGNSYGYDAEGRMLSAGSGAYVYDGDGNRVEKTASSTTTLYWFGAGSLLDESDGTGTTMAKQVQFAGLQVWSESVASGGRFLFQDHLGSTRITGDAAGNLKDDLDYVSFGSLMPNLGASPSDNHYTFTGYESDQSESNTDYAVYRNADTEMGRFNRPDPYDGSYDPTNPQSLNRYTYVMNRPLSYRDSLGLASCIDEGTDTVVDRRWGTTVTHIYDIVCVLDYGNVSNVIDAPGGGGGSGSSGPSVNYKNSSQRICIGGNCVITVYYGTSPFGNVCAVNKKLDGSPAGLYSLSSCTGNISSCIANGPSFQQACRDQGQTPLDCSRGFTVELGQFYACPCCSY